MQCQFHYSALLLLTTKLGYMKSHSKVSKQMFFKIVVLNKVKTFSCFILYFHHNNRPNVKVICTDKPQRYSNDSCSSAQLYRAFYHLLTHCFDFLACNLIHFYHISSLWSQYAAVLSKINISESQTLVPNSRQKKLT